MRETRPVLLLTLTLLGVLLAWPLRADAGTCGVLPFSAGATVNKGAAPNITQLVSSELDIRGGYDLVTAAKAEEFEGGDCGANAACIKQFGTANKHDAVVAGRVDQDGTNYALVLKLYDGKSAALIREVKRSVPSSALELPDAVTAVVVELVTGKGPESSEKGRPEATTAAASARFDDLDFDEMLDDADPGTATAKPRSKAAPRNPDLDAKTSGKPDEDPFGLDSELDEIDLSAEEIARQRKERERLDALERERRAEDQRIADEKAEADRRARLEEERERQEEDRRRAEDDRARKDRAERERLAEIEAARAEELERQRVATERADRDRREKERLASEEREREESERQARADRERREREKLDAENRAREESVARAERVRRDEEEAESTARAERDRRTQEDAASLARADRERRTQEDAARTAQAERERRDRESAKSSESRSSAAPVAASSEASLGSALALGPAYGIEIGGDDDDDEGGFSIGPAGDDDDDDEEGGFSIGPADDDDEDVDLDRQAPKEGMIMGDGADEHPSVRRRREAEARAGGDEVDDKEDDRYARARAFNSSSQDDASSGSRDDRSSGSRDDRSSSSRDDASSSSRGDKSSSSRGDKSASTDARPAGRRAAEEDADLDEEADRDRVASRDETYLADALDTDERAYATGRSSASTVQRGDTKARNRPWVSARLAGGYTNYYLHFAQYGLDVGIFPVPRVSVDLLVDFWTLSIRECPECEQEFRTLPSFYLGGSYRFTQLKIVQPYVGGDVGAVVYAIGTLDDGAGNLTKKPLMGVAFEVKGGADFMFTRHFGLGVGVKGGLAYASKIKENVHPDWKPLQFLLNVRFAAVVQF